MASVQTIAPEPEAPVLSVVTALFNRVDLTRAMVESLRATLPAGLAHEVILVDDGSTDGTRAWLETLGPPFRVILNDRNLGYAAANNRGCACAEGRILALLNNDLVLRPGWLDPMLKARETIGPRVGIVGNVQVSVATGCTDHAGVFIGPKGKPEHVRIRPGPLTRLRSPVRRVQAVTGACAVLSADLWRELGGFDAGYRNGCEDIDLCLRARAAGRTNAVALRSTVAHHVSASPGRRDRDEANTYRFVLRWREELALLGREAWIRSRFGEGLADPRDFPSTAWAWKTALHLAGLWPSPPADAAAGIRGAIDLELIRWGRMFGSTPPEA